MNQLVGTIGLCLAVGLGLGCAGELIPDDPGGGGGGGGGGADAGIDEQFGELYFDTNIAPMLSRARPKGACIQCHQGSDPANGPDFLGATNAAHYNNLMANTTLIALTPATSLLLTKADHDGDEFCTAVSLPYATCPADELTQLNEWILIEAQ